MVMFTADGREVQGSQANGQQDGKQFIEVTRIIIRPQLGIVGDLVSSFDTESREAVREPSDNVIVQQTHTHMLTHRHAG